MGLIRMELVKLNSINLTASSKLKLIKTTKYIKCLGVSNFLIESLRNGFNKNILTAAKCKYLI